ncbi:hypothetical protein [Streptomyces sp. NPDC057052]|uniref:hypothetical protein n=1 Tax=Streptomyces sp. NPDC057052 TaxID=3346010 RepID=UPI0036393A16
MRATFMYGPGDVRVENVPDPRIVEPVRHGAGLPSGKRLVGELPHERRSFSVQRTLRHAGLDAVAVIEE